MIVLRFRNSGEHEDLLKKIKKMKKFTEELEDCLEERIEEEDDYGFRDDRRMDEDMEFRGGRYSYRGMGGSRRGRM